MLSSAPSTVYTLLLSVVALSCVLTAHLVSAQEPPASPQPDPENAQRPAEQLKPDAQVLRVPLSGDTIYLKNERILTNVQIVRSTPRYYEVQMFEGVKPIRVDRQQVKSIDWDDIDPIRERLKDKFLPDVAIDSQISAQQLSPAFRAKLTAPFTDQPINFDARPIVQVLEELAARSKITIDISQAVRDLPENKREWTFTVEPGTTMLAVLQDQLQTAFPNLRVNFEFDKVTVLTAKEAEADATAAAPPETPQNGQ